eukprot:s1138_g5.t1
MVLCSLVLYLTLSAGGDALYGTIFAYIAGEVLYRSYQLWRWWRARQVKRGLVQVRYACDALCQGLLLEITEDSESNQSSSRLMHQLPQLLEQRCQELCESEDDDLAEGQDLETALWSALRLAESLACLHCDADAQAALHASALMAIERAQKPEVLVAALEVLSSLQAQPRKANETCKQAVVSLVASPEVLEKLLLLLPDVEEDNQDAAFVAWVLLQQAERLELQKHLEVLESACEAMNDELRGHLSPEFLHFIDKVREGKVTDECLRKRVALIRCNIVFRLTGGPGPRGKWCGMTAAMPFEPEGPPQKSEGAVGRFNWPEVRPPQPPEVPNRDPATCILSKLIAHPEEATREEVAETEPVVRERLWQWARPQVEGEGPCARGGHTATLVGPTDPQKPSARIVIFGGHYDGGSGAGFVYLNDTHILDIDENNWTVPRCRGTAPEPRYGHAAALVGGRVVYFGGRGKTSCFRDLHALDTSSHTWFQGPSSGGAPSARHGHTANLHGTRLYVFGGTCSGKYFGDLHCLDLASMAWSCPPATGPKPSPRCGHTALLIGESLLVHGGFCMETPDIATKDNSGDLLKNSYCNDVRVLDLGRMLWSRLRTHGTPPTGRFSHTLSLSEDDAIVFGGWSGTSSQAASVTFALREKVVADEDEEKEKPAEETCEFCMTLRTSDMQWVQNKYVGNPPSKRYGHTATAIGPHVIIFGGWDGGKPLNDVIVLRDRSVADRAKQEVMLILWSAFSVILYDEGRCTSMVKREKLCQVKRRISSWRLVSSSRRVELESRADPNS